MTDLQEALNHERNAIMRAELALREKESLERELSRLKAKRAVNWSTLIPVIVATIGATASFAGIAYSDYRQAVIAEDESNERTRLARDAAVQEAEKARLAAENQYSLQRDAQEAALEQRLLGIVLSANVDSADRNLRFLAIAGMVPRYKKEILDALDEGHSFSIHDVK